MNYYNLNQFEEDILETFIHNNDYNISNEEKKQYILDLTHFFEIIYNNSQNNNRDKFISNFNDIYNKIIYNNIFNCVKNDITNIYNYIITNN